MHDYCNTVPNVEEENGEPNKNFVAEVRAYLEEQKFKARVQWKEMQDKSVVVSIKLKITLCPKILQ